MWGREEGGGRREGGVCVSDRGWERVCVGGRRGGCVLCAREVGECVWGGGEGVYGGGGGGRGGCVGGRRGGCVEGEWEGEGLCGGGEGVCYNIFQV